MQVNRGIIRNEHWYEYVPKLVETIHVGVVSKLWNQQMLTDITIPNNKLDVTIRDNEEGTCLLTDTAISADMNAIKKEAEMILIYIDLTTETTHVECKKQK
jgi:hypothetical protein